MNAPELSISKYDKTDPENISLDSIFDAVISARGLTLRGSITEEWEAEGEYQAVISKVRTPDFSLDANIDSFTIGLGDADGGIVAWSSDGLFQFDLPTFSFDAEVTEVKFSIEGQGKIKRGTYGPELCFFPATGAWAKDITFSSSSSQIVSHPAAIEGGQGEADACAQLGTAAST